MPVGASLSNGLRIEALEGGGGHLVTDVDGTNLGIVHDDRVASFLAAVGLAEGETFAPPPGTTRRAVTASGYEPENPTWLAHGLYLTRDAWMDDSTLRDASHDTLGTVFGGGVSRFVEAVGTRDAVAGSDGA